MRLYMAKFTKSSTLAKILKKEKTEEVLSKHNVPCVSCPMATMEVKKLQIGDVCKMYNIKLEALLKDLNKL